MTSEQIGIVLDELVNQSNGIENGTMLYDVVDLPSPGAIEIEPSHLPSMQALLKKFNRAAILTDIAWLKKIRAIKGTFSPGLEIKTFSREQKQQAENRLSG